MSKETKNSGIEIVENGFIINGDKSRVFGSINEATEELKDQLGY